MKKGAAPIFIVNIKKLLFPKIDTHGISITNGALHDSLSILNLFFRYKYVTMFVLWTIKKIAVAFST